MQLSWVCTGGFGFHLNVHLGTDSVAVRGSVLTCDCRRCQSWRPSLQFGV